MLATVTTVTLYVKELEIVRHDIHDITNGS